MSFKKWLGDRSKPKEPEPVIVDDLIILEQWDQAERMLKERLKKSSADLQAKLKLAEVYERTSRPREARPPVARRLRARRASLCRNE